MSESSQILKLPSFNRSTRSQGKNSFFQYNQTHRKTCIQKHWRMMSEKLEVGADSSCSLESEQQPMTTGSTFFQKQGGRSRAPEVRKKVGSIKLSKSPSLRSHARRAKSRSKPSLVIDLSSDAASSPKSSPSSTCSDARTDNNFQVSHWNSLL